MVAQPREHFSFEEYLALEKQTGIKHEYYRGNVYAMTGATPRHNIIVANVIGSIYAQLRGNPCTVYPSDLRVKVERTGLYTYPDISVVCGDLRIDDDRSNTVLNPIVIVEVLSPSTRDYDRGLKFQHYRTIGSLQEYIVIAQDMLHIEHYSRQDEDHWLLAEYHHTHQTLSLRSIGCHLSLDDIYEKVTFSSQDAEGEETELHAEG